MVRAARFGSQGSEGRCRFYRAAENDCGPCSVDFLLLSSVKSDYFQVQ